MSTTVLVGAVWAAVLIVGLCWALYLWLRLADMAVSARSLILPVAVSVGVVLLTGLGAWVAECSPASGCVPGDRYGPVSVTCEAP